MKIKISNKQANLNRDYIYSFPKVKKEQRIFVTTSYGKKRRTPFDLDGICSNKKTATKYANKLKQGIMVGTIIISYKIRIIKKKNKYYVYSLNDDMKDTKRKTTKKKTFTHKKLKIKLKNKYKLRTDEYRGIKFTLKNINYFNTLKDVTKYIDKNKNDIKTWSLQEYVNNKWINVSYKVKKYWK